MTCRKFTLASARYVQRLLGTEFDTRQFLRGMNVEREHAADFGCKALTMGRIAKVHLDEDKNYYRKLCKHVEKCR